MYVGLSIACFCKEDDKFFGYCTSILVSGFEFFCYSVSCYFTILSFSILDYYESFANLSVMFRGLGCFAATVGSFCSCAGVC